MNNTIYSSDAESYVSLPNSSGHAVEGIWHSHPVRGDSAQQLIDRYASPGDWAALAAISSQVGANPNSSIWLTDSFGITREFKFADRSYYENLSLEAMLNGQGSDGSERQQSCS